MQIPWESESIWTEPRSPPNTDKSLGHGFARLVIISVGGNQLRTYTYDQDRIDSTYSQNVNGRLATITYPAISYDVPTSSRQGTTTFTDMFSYTAYGAVAGKRLRVTKTNPYGTNQTQTAVGDLNMSYAYNTEGKLSGVTYLTDAGTNTTPSYNYSYDAMMRPSGMTDQNSASVVSGVLYGAGNEMLQMTYDGGTEARSYNTMFQLTNITFSSGAFNQNITYNFPAGTNNGKIASQSDAISSETVTYQYDSLNRLISASAASWSQTYSYDGFGNLTGRVGTGTAQSTTISKPADASTNRLSGYSYDANGNLLSVGNVYDVENRLAQQPISGGTIHYFYDGQNKRIWQGYFTNSNDPQLLTVETVSMFGADGKLAGSYTPQANWTNTTSQATITFSGSQRVYFAGKLIGPGTVIQDRLGTVGKFYPYGEQRDSSGTMFATYTRDATGLDYANQRYYANTFGRFLTPDPLRSSARAQDPQSWNRYSYVQGDPVNSYDPTGLLVGSPDDGGGDDLSCTVLDIYDPLWCGGFIRPIPIALPPRLTSMLAKLDNLYEQGFVEDWVLGGTLNNPVVADITLNWDNVFDYFATAPVALPAPGAYPTFWDWFLAALKASPVLAPVSLFLIETGSNSITAPPPNKDQCPDKDHFWNPDQAPHDGWKLIDPGSNTWVSPDGNYTLRPDLSHPGPKGPHWELKRGGDPRTWECFPDGTMNAKGWNNP